MVMTPEDPGSGARMALGMVMGNNRWSMAWQLLQSSVFFYDSRDVRAATWPRCCRKRQCSS